MVSYLYLNFLIFASLRKTLIIEMFKELRELGFFPQIQFLKQETQGWNRQSQNLKVSFICYFLSDDKHQSKNSICMFIQKKIFIQFFFSYSSNILKYWKILTLAEVNLKKKIKDPTAHDIPRYFPQLLVTLQFWLCPRNRNPQLQLLLDMWKKHMLKQLTKL